MSEIFFRSKTANDTQENLITAKREKRMQSFSIFSNALNKQHFFPYCRWERNFQNPQRTVKRGNKVFSCIQSEFSPFQEWIFLFFWWQQSLAEDIQIETKVYVVVFLWQFREFWKNDKVISVAQSHFKLESFLWKLNFRRCHYMAYLKQFDVLRCQSW